MHKTEFENILLGSRKLLQAHDENETKKKQRKMLLMEGDSL